ncbi:MAG: helix-hairpin-helix domain-containing protein, partial [Desulfosudaceae bacterium]
VIYTMTAELTEISGVGPARSESLAESGYPTIESIASAEPEALATAADITEDKALDFIVQAQNLLPAPGDEESSHVVAAVASSFLDRAIPAGTVVLGEVGLTGEVRAINHIETRVAEIKKMGFNNCLLPHGNLKRMAHEKKIRIQGVKTVADAMEALFRNG